MASYTPLQTGQAPTFGTSGQAVADLQTQLNTQNQGKAGWTPLVVDAKFGPLTQAAQTWKPENQLIVTGTNPANQFGKNSQELDNLLGQVGTQPQTPGTNVNPGVKEQQDLNKMVETYSDPYTQMLDKIGATSDKATQNLIATIKSNKSAREANINLEYDRLKQGLFSLGLSTERLSFTPDLVYGSITQAENERMSKLQTLDQDEATALLEAQQAREDKDFKLLKERMDYIKGIKKSRLDILKESYDTLNYESKIGELQANQIYDELQNLSEEKKVPFLQQLATKFDIPLAALTSQVAQITRDRKKEAEKSSGSGGGYTSQEKRKLRQAGIDPTDIEAADDFLYGDEEDYNFYDLGDQYSEDPENLDNKGYLTPDKFKSLVLQGQKDKISKANVIERYKDKLNLKNKRKAREYGFTDSEWSKYK